MKKKGIIGLFGLASLAMAGLTVQATLPTYAANSTNVTVQLTVLPSGEALQIELPTDGNAFTSDKVTVRQQYAEAKDIEWRIVYKDDAGTETTYPMPQISVADPHGNATSGTHEDQVDLTALNGGKYGSYKIISMINNKPSTEDVVTFEYRALKIKDNGIDQNNNNPQVIIDHGPNVDHVNVQIYDQNGNPVLPAPINVPTTDTTGGHGGSTNWTVPVTENNLKDGHYCVVFTAYDNLGNILDRNAKYCFDYTSKKAPLVPDTGGSIFAGTNFTNADYISTSLAVFFVAAFFALMVLKRNRKAKRR
jgi:hypothetical protein